MLKPFFTTKTGCRKEADERATPPGTRGHAAFLIHSGMRVKKNGSGQQPTLLSGGNPQIPMGYGERPILAYIAAMPGWKQAVGAQLHRLISATVPQVRKAVKWNSPFYGVDNLGWQMAIHCYTRYVQVTFLNGALLRPLPPTASKNHNTRYLNIHEGEEIDEHLFTDWVKQASQLPGWLTSDIQSRH